MNQDQESQLIAALNGEFGEDAQEEAEDWMEENGYVVTEEENGYDGDGATDEAERRFEAELGRLRRRAGRNLTEAEIQRIVDDLPEGDIPDLVEKHGEELAGRAVDRESRVEMMAEAAEGARRAQEAAADPEYGGVA